MTDAKEADLETWTRDQLAERNGVLVRRVRELEEALTEFVVDFDHIDDDALPVQCGPSTVRNIRRARAALRTPGGSGI